SIRQAMIRAITLRTDLRMMNNPPSFLPILLRFCFALSPEGVRAGMRSAERELSHYAVMAASCKFRAAEIRHLPA
ncbi:MAG: hypothetical protein II010_03835, partial [Oscillospiraceae bacterium]|nr:hypothetical protein [Oscillospiraceae bacterium]